MGVFTELDGSNKYQLEELRDKVEIWVNLIFNGYLHRRLVWKAFWGAIWSTVVYPLPVTTLTEEQGEWITKELYRKSLPEIGVNRIFPWAYCRASKRVTGMDQG